MSTPRTRRRFAAGAITAIVALTGGAVGVAPSASAVTAGTPSVATAVATPAYDIGAGMYDITGEAAESNLWGYANMLDTDGIQQRTRSRAFVVRSRTSGQRVAMVTADLGSIQQSVTLEVIRRLKARYGSLYTEDNVMLMATHTHVGSGGQAHDPLYVLASADKSGFGYSSRNFEVTVNGIVTSIVRATDNLTPGSIEYVEGQLTGASKNRSLAGYNANTDAAAFPTTVNQTMSMFKFTAADGTPIGVLNWFAVHATSLSITFSQLSGDNKGYAAQFFERRMGTDYSRSKTFVAAFANADEGDSVPSDGNAMSAPGFQGSSNELLNAERAGTRQLDKAWALYNTPGRVLDGTLSFRHRYANMEGYTVTTAYTGNGTRTLCAASQGISFAAGGENGPSNIPGITEGMTKSNTTISSAIAAAQGAPLGGAVNFLFGAISWGIQDPCQGAKPNLLPTGALDWVPETVPFQLFRVGDVAVIGAPAEVTTMSGRRIRQTVLNRMSASGVRTAVIGGLANTYSGYIATPEEFATQQYEGASTTFGPDTLAAYRQEFDRLADALVRNVAVADDRQPRDRRGEARLERPGVVWDGKFGNETFGQVLTNATASYTRGSTVSVSYRGGHPKNNLRTQGSFLTVQRLVNGVWTNYLYDWDWETTYRWKRDGADRSIVTVDWRIAATTPAGTYRIVQTGDWKSGLTGAVSSYTGTSRTFTVS